MLIDGTTISTLSLPSFVQREVRFVFPGEQYVANPTLDLERRRQPRAPESEHGDVLEDLRDEVTRFRRQLPPGCFSA